MQIEGRPHHIELRAWRTRSSNQFYLEFGSWRGFIQSFRKGVRGRWAEAPIDSLVSALSSPATVARHLGDRLVEHLRAELANRKVPGTRHRTRRPRGPDSDSATASPSSLPPGSFCRRPSASTLPPSPQDRGFPHAVRSRGSVPDSRTLPSPGALAPGDLLPQPTFISPGGRAAVSLSVK